MKKLATLLIAGLIACSHVPAPAPKPVTSLFPVPTTAEISKAVYKIQSDEHQGTAWAIGPHTLVTAGHVCDDEGPYSLQSEGGQLFSADKYKYQLSDEDGRIDACVLKTGYDLPYSLKLAPFMPTVDWPVETLGYPRGKFVNSWGKFLGDLDGDDTWNDCVISAPGDHGLSGGPVYTEVGVIGLVVRARTETGEIASGITGTALVCLPDLTKFLDEIEIPYDIADLADPFTKKN